MPELDKNIRKLILHHYRRAGIEQSEREFHMILEKDGEMIKVGEYVPIGEGTGHRPREIYALIEDGWTPIIVQSCFRWYWDAKRYISPWNEREVRKSGKTIEYDVYDKPRIEVLYSGYFEKAHDFRNGKNYAHKFAICHFDEQEINYFGKMPEEFQKMIHETEWMEMEDDPEDGGQKEKNKKGGYKNEVQKSFGRIVKGSYARI